MRASDDRQFNEYWRHVVLFGGVVGAVAAFLILIPAVFLMTRDGRTPPNWLLIPVVMVSFVPALVVNRRLVKRHPPPRGRARWN